MSDDDKKPLKACEGKKDSVVYSEVHFEIAKTSRAKCTECCVSIEKGEVKISKEVNSQNGKVIKSFHPNCALHVQTCEDNRSKCQTCKEKLSIGQIRVKVGSSCKTGPGTKHHYTCIAERGANEGFQEKLLEILNRLKSGAGKNESCTSDTKNKKEDSDTKPIKAKIPPRVSRPKKKAEEEEEDDDDEDEDDDGSNEDGDDAEEEPVRRSRKKVVDFSEEDGPVRKSSRSKAKVSYNVDGDAEDDE